MSSDCCSKNKAPVPGPNPVCAFINIIIDTIKPYQPLVVMVLAVIAAAIALSIRFDFSAMQLFMGLFLVNFAMFKLFDINGFATSFAMYDIIGKRSRPYGLAYPFIELALGAGFLLNFNMNIICTVTAIIMSIGLIGIVQNFLTGTKTRCACMGTLINVPVGSVTILENTTMIVMSVMMLFYH